MQITLAISPLVLEKFPTFHRGIVVAEGIDNSGYHPELEQSLASALDYARRQPIDLTHDTTSVMWKQAHEACGSNPNRFPPSHIAMRKRVQNGKDIPFINPVVAIMNINSLAVHTSVGGDDIDRVGKHLTLRFAGGDETFVPLLQESSEEHPDPGEVIYVDEAGSVMCRRWNWRNSHISRIRDTTRRMVMNIDGLGDGCESIVIRTRDRIAEMLQEFCNAHVTTALLHSGAPERRFPSVVIDPFA